MRRLWRFQIDLLALDPVGDPQEAIVTTGARIKKTAHSAASKAILAAVLASISAALSPSARADNVRVIEGQAFWTGDPGPVSDPYWTQGQYKYDPNGYLERNWFDPEYHPMTVIGEHEGKANCVFRRRVTITTWEFQHPILRICRTPPDDSRP